MATYRTAGEPIRQKVNQYQDDPIQNRSMTDECWNGHHYEGCDNEGAPIGCSGWKPICDRCTANQCNLNDCVCNCHVRCECLCHEAEKPKRKVGRAKQQEHTMSIMDTGCGTVDIKK